MRVYLIRHTTPLIEKGVCYGQADIPLNELLFIEESQRILAKLPENIDAYYASPLLRCTKLAEQLSPEFQIDDRLMELNFGKWELEKWSEIHEDHLNPWMEDFVNQKTPQGESYLSLHERSGQFIEFVLKMDHKKTALITHAGNIRSFISFALDLPLENSFRIELNYGSIVELELNEDKRFNKLISII